MRENFVGKLRLNPENKERLNTINGILTDYQRQGYILTLRQLYYQLVTKNVIANTDREYSKLSSLLVKGRMAGIVDWSAIEDRVRTPKIPYSADDIPDALEDILHSYRLDRMRNQNKYVEVWVEKDALSSVFYRITSKYHIRLMVNRGYSSCSAIYDAYNRFAKQMTQGKDVTVLYCGDHDPSGLDMIRDVNDRIVEMLSNSNAIHNYVLDDDDRREKLNEELWHEYYNDPKFWSKDDNGDDAYEWYKAYPLKHFEVVHVGLKTEQVKQYKPPPNPAKITDPRAKWYIKKYGNVSWELDALNPETLIRLIETAILKVIDEDLYDEVMELENKEKVQLKNIINKERKKK